MQLDQSEAQPRSVISMEFLRSFLRRHFAVETSCGITKCQLFSQAKGEGTHRVAISTIPGQAPSDRPTIRL